jgi:hypothetical protein
MLTLKKKPVKKAVKQVPVKKVAVKKVFTSFKPQVRSRHPSHKWLRENLPLFPFRSIIRLGSTMTLQEAYPSKTSDQLARIKEINSVQGVKNSSSKLLMKQCFTRAGVKTADWFTTNGTTMIWRNDEATTLNLRDLPYPLIAKSHYGSRGEGNTLINNQQELESWMRGKTVSNYIFEKYYTYNREYRLHVTKNGCFYTCRKMLKRDTPDDKKFQRHDDNCVWIMDTNPAFDKPVNWKEIEADCVKALKSLGLDIAGFDVKVQSAKDAKGKTRATCDWIVIESGSACSHGEVTKVKYREEIIKLLKNE